MARLTCSVRVVQLCIESRLWMEKLEDQLMSASGKLHRGMRWPVKVRKGPFVSQSPRLYASVCCNAESINAEDDETDPTQFAMQARPNDIFAAKIRGFQILK